MLYKRENQVLQEWLSDRMCKVFVSCGLALAVAMPVQAQNYPNKPIKLIAPFPPGGSVDLVARLVSARLTEAIGQQVIVDNRGGASGNIGTELAARSAPDGYTLMVHTIPFVANTFLMSRVPYDPINDFVPIMMVSSSPSLLIVHPAVPAKNVAELIALAKAKPGALNYGTAGTASNPHIAGELFNYLAKTEIMPVHYKGGGPALIANMAGDVGIGFANFSETVASARDGRVRALAITTSKRSALLPNVPTIAESGLPGYEFTTWQGVFAPKGTPPAIVNLVNERLRKSLTTPEHLQSWQDRGLDVVASTPEQFAAHLKLEVQKWGKVIRERGMKAD